MLRRALLLSAALVGGLGCTDAWAGQTKVTVRGELSAMALAGNAVIVVRQPDKADIRVERLVAGKPAQTLLRLPGTGRRTAEAYEEERVISTTLAASPQALVLSVQRLESFGASRVFVGPPTGPLREVAACQRGLLLPAVAVSGSRVAWTSGGCAEPVKKPVSATDATIVTGDADPSVALGLIPLSNELLPTALVLDGQSGVAGLARPTLLSFFKSEVRRLGAGTLGETLTTQSGAIVVPVGILPNGETVHTITLDGGDDDDEDRDSVCRSSLFAIARQSTHRRALTLPGCPFDNDESFAAGSAQVAGDRVYAIVDDSPPSEDEDDDDRPPPIGSLKSIRGDGSAVRVLAKSAFRPPRGFATGEAGRVGWWQRNCTRGQEVLIDDGAAQTASAATTPACNLRVLTRSARVRRGVISLRLRCPSGCHGQVTARRRFVREFTLKPGTHRVALRLKPRERRVKRLLLHFNVDNGSNQRRTIRLR